MKLLLMVLFVISMGSLQAEELSASGRITAVDLEARTISINNIPYRINDNTVVKFEDLAIDPDRLETGAAVTFGLENSVITQMEVESKIEFNE